jgi:glycogen operon protein
MRNMLATLLFSQGVPMLSHGDEMARTQQGNNNAYCQDNEISWVNWDLTDSQQSLCEFVAQLVRFRMSQPVLRRRKYFQGRSIRGGGVKDVAWLAPDGREMTDEAWTATYSRSLGMLLSGNAIEEVDERGEPLVGDTLLILLNAHHAKVPFTLPPLEADRHWHRVIDTVHDHTSERNFKPGHPYPLQGQSVAVFTVTPPVYERRRTSAVTQSKEVVPIPAAASVPVDAA